MDIFKHILPIKNITLLYREFGYVVFRLCLTILILTRGTIDFVGQRIIEQDLYSSNEQLRNTNVYIRRNECGHNITSKAKLVDPYLLLIQHDSSRYSYVSRDQIEFTKNPLMDGTILAVRLDDSITAKTSMTYLTRGLWWTPRYEVIVINDQCKVIFYFIYLIY
jgi:hypothetical protein